MLNANCTFSISNLNDDVQVDCRLYFPKQPSRGEAVRLSGFAIVAHPYAPLGGCYDDPVVQTIGSALLKQGFVLCTFNFRGAAGSSGSTSWTGKAELADYVSVYTFILHLINFPGVTEYLLVKDDRPVLVLGGYSYVSHGCFGNIVLEPRGNYRYSCSIFKLWYTGMDTARGSMIASHLPDLASMETISNSAVEGSPDHEIYLRSQEIAKILLGYLQTRALRKRKSAQTNSSSDDPTLTRDIMIGGYDSDESERRARRNSSHKSLDRVRHSFERVKVKLSAKGGSHDVEQHNDTIDTSIFLIEPSIAYLLISPLLQPVAGFTTAFSRLVFHRTNTVANPKPQKSTFQNLSENPTLAIYGDRDMFTSARRLRKWSQELTNAPASRFRSEEVTGGGHFWHENGVSERLYELVREWTTSLNDRRAA